MHTILIAAAILGLASAAWTPPKFCGSNSCPEFKVVNSGGPIERKYESSKWVTTRQTGFDYSAGKRMMFWRLFRYIQGNNTANKKINMTVPVICKITPGSPNDFEMSFYLDIDNAPQPSDSNVRLTTLPQDLDVFVREYDGYSSETKAAYHAEKLKGELVNQSLPHNTQYYYNTGYDSPWKFFNRHNEIWVPRN